MVDLSLKIDDLSVLFRLWTGPTRMTAHLFSKMIWTTGTCPRWVPASSAKWSEQQAHAPGDQWTPAATTAYSMTRQDVQLGQPKHPWGTSCMVTVQPPNIQMYTAGFTMDARISICWQVKEEEEGRTNWKEFSSFLMENIKMGSSNCLPAKINKEKKNHREREKQQQGMYHVFQQNNCINPCVCTDGGHQEKDRKSKTTVTNPRKTVMNPEKEQLHKSKKKVTDLKKWLPIQQTVAYPWCIMVN